MTNEMLIHYSMDLESRSHKWRIAGPNQKWTHFIFLSISSRQIVGRVVSPDFINCCFGGGGVGTKIMTSNDTRWREGRAAEIESERKKTADADRK